jgi:hypothetical protein
MIKKILLITVIGLLFNTCNVKTGKNESIRSSKVGILNLKTEFYDSKGNSIFLAPMKIWYKDSLVIEEIVRISSVTDTANNTTVSFPPQVYRYIDLDKKSWYDYKTFTDTSTIIKSGILPDSLFTDYGWTFYANNLHMKTQPEILRDTIIEGIKHMRIKFSRLKSRQINSYVIGYLRCDNKGKLFSLEKTFSNRVNCTMTQYYDFNEGALRPSTSTELQFLSDTLSSKELEIFQKWKSNQIKFPAH